MTNFSEDERSSSGRSSVNGHKDFDNLAYDNFERKKNDYASGMGQPKTDPYTSVTTFNEEKRLYDNSHLESESGGQSSRL